VEARSAGGIAAEAGLTPKTSFDLSYAFEYTDEETLTRLLLAPAGIAKLVGPSREQEAKGKILEGLASRRTAEGGYRLENEFPFVIAEAP
jgi:hypothetical protein